MEPSFHELCELGLQSPPAVNKAASWHWMTMQQAGRCQRPHLTMQRTLISGYTWEEEGCHPRCKQRSIMHATYRRSTWTKCDRAEHEIHQLCRDKQNRTCPTAQTRIRTSWLWEHKEEARITEIRGEFDELRVFTMLLKAQSILHGNGHEVASNASGQHLEILLFPTAYTLAMCR